MNAFSWAAVSVLFGPWGQADTILLVPTSMPTGWAPVGPLLSWSISSSEFSDTRVYFWSPPIVLSSCPALGGLCCPRGGDGLLVAGLFLEPSVIQVLPLAADVLHRLAPPRGL